MKALSRWIWMTAAPALVLVATLTVATGTASAQDDKKTDEAAMMAAWQKAATPGEAHQLLASMAGTWNVTSKTWMSPDAPPMESKGTSKKTMILDGRFLQEELDAQMMGMPMKGLGLTGYNNTTGMWEFTWMDNMGTMMMTGGGKKEGDTITMESNYTDPLTGEKAWTKMVTAIQDKDHYTFTMYGKADGKETKMMEASYSRAM